MLVTVPSLKTVCRGLAELTRSVGQLAAHAAVFVSAFVAPRAQTAATVVAFRRQLARRVERVWQTKESKPRFSPAFRAVWVVISRLLDGWEDLRPIGGAGHSQALAQRGLPATVVVEVPASSADPRQD